MKPIVVHCLLLTRGGEGVNQRIHYQYVGVSRKLTLRTCETAVSAQRTIEKQNQSRSQTDSECHAAAIQYATNTHEVEECPSAVGNAPLPSTEMEKAFLLEHLIVVVILFISLPATTTASSRRNASAVMCATCSSDARVST